MKEDANISEMSQRDLNELFFVTMLYNYVIYH